MEIGVVAAYFPPEVSAAAVRIGPFVEEWASQESCTVHVFAPRSENEASDAYANYPNVRIHRVPAGIADNTRSLPARFLSEVALCFLVFWRSLTVKVDVYVTSSPPFLIAVTTLLVSLISRTPFVLDVRDLYPEQLFSYKVVSRDSWFGRFLQWLERQVYDHALLVAGVTEGLTRYIERRTSTDVVLIRNGIDSRQFYRRRHRATDGGLAKGERTNFDEFVILFHGTLGRSQNVELLLTYAEHVKQEREENVTIRVIGDGPKADVLRCGIENRNIGSILEYIGRVDFDEIPDLLNRADVGFSPRVDGLVNETAFPVKVYECLGCGLPVVVTPKSEAGRYVERNEVGFQHRNGDVEGIHESICRLKENPKLYKEYSDRAVRVAESFDRHKLGRKLQNEIASRLW
ncbi:glycosyltransferase family 4 protein [Salinibacter ruber]|uniref:glycosyltransferase family 4 protein n=1 Tax=Salinibacter ruber TaxID=146919 RepID=UPI00216879AA|nr:glycosyltransferase family 4 protein [Salinibacter ruber]MCS3683879.1 glycosyltransferase involved in cell wall biosynthesis [Salinibacter ruber]